MDRKLGGARSGSVSASTGPPPPRYHPPPGVISGKGHVSRDYIHPTDTTLRLCIHCCNKLIYEKKMGINDKPPPPKRPYQYPCPWHPYLNNDPGK